jgi:hypothetical protein
MKIFKNMKIYGALHHFVMMGIGAFVFIHFLTWNELYGYSSYGLGWDLFGFDCFWF